MSRLKAMKSVYCYFFPEVRTLLREVRDTLPDDMYLVTTPAEKVRESLKPLFNPPLEVPATPEGYVSLDEIHVPIIERIVTTYSSLIPDLRGFKYSYPTPGSSEGIFKYLTKLKVEGRGINVLDGEYEGYEEYAGPQDLKMQVNKINPERTGLKKLQSGVWFISNPSARDGNIIPNEFITGLCERGHQVVLDLSYVGATRPFNFDVNHENIPVVFLSFSKPYGVFRFRMGIVFSREPIHSLYGNKWFKDTERLLQALKISEDIGPVRLYERYRPVQEEIVEGINRDFGLGMNVSDSLLIGYLTRKDARMLNSDQLNLIAHFRRGDGYKFCLTPYFEEREREEKLKKNG